MKLEEMKRIASQRTPGEWNRWIRFRGAKNVDTLALKSGWVDNPSLWIGEVSECNAEFIAMAANNWDKLIAVVEAAKKQFEYLPARYLNLEKALEALEAE